MTTAGTIARTSARGQAELSVVEIITYLEERMERALVALGVGTDASTISRWKSGSVTPGHERESRLRNLHTVFQMLEQADDAHIARAWLMGVNPQLDDRSPLECIAEGEIKAVLAAARAFADGA